MVTLFPYVMMTILLINSATLDGAADGIEFYLNPDLDRLADEQVTIYSKGDTILVAVLVNLGLWLTRWLISCSS